MASGFRPQTSSLDCFLLSEVEIQPNGMPLTVLSMLARVGADPWEEAASLSLLPNELAVSRLVGAIVRCSPHSRNRPEVTALASRLIDRLPEQRAPLQADPMFPNGIEFIPIWKSMIVFCATLGVLLIMVQGFG